MVQYKQSITKEKKNQNTVTDLYGSIVNKAKISSNNQNIQTKNKGKFG